MARLSMAINASQLPKEEAYKPIPDGRYIATISDATIKNTKDNNGQYISLKLVIVEGSYKGRALYDNINISNLSEIAVEIGMKRLGTYLSIGNISVLEDTEQLKNITVCINVYSEEYNQKQTNKIKSVIEPTQAQAPAQAPTQAPIQTPVQTPVQAPVSRQAPQAGHWSATQPQPQQPPQPPAPISWQTPVQTPVQPTIQSTQETLNDEIPF